MCLVSLNSPELIVNLHWLNNISNAEALLGGFGWHYNDIVEEFGLGPIIQYHIVSHVYFLFAISLPG